MANQKRSGQKLVWTQGLASTGGLSFGYFSLATSKKKYLVCPDETGLKNESST